MNINKLYWKTLYYWIRYLNYDLIHQEKDDNEIWLAHKRKKSIAIFRKEVSSTQEIRFDKSNFLERPKDVEQRVGYKPHAIDFYYFSDKNISEDNMNDCLLYTSPSPRDATLNRMPSSA